MPPLTRCSTASTAKPLPDSCEITLEANPGTFEQAKFADYLGIGAGAHGKQTRDGSISRSSKYRAPGA